MYYPHPESGLYLVEQAALRAGLIVSVAMATYEFVFALDGDRDAQIRLTVEAVASLLRDNELSNALCVIEQRLRHLLGTEALKDALK